MSYAARSLTVRTRGRVTGHHRYVRGHAADDFGGNPVPVFPGPRRLVVHELPEGRRVLREIAKDEIGAVAAEIFLAGCILGLRQDIVGIIRRSDQRTVSSPLA